MRIPADQVSSPTYNADLARATVELCERDLRGVYHLAGAACSTATRSPCSSARCSGSIRRA